jgi:repressor LexA
MKVMSIDFIGERLKELRFKRNIKQKDLAKKLGISQAQVARYESYQNRPSFAMVKLMAMVLDTTTEYLLGETEEDKENQEIETLEIETRPTFMENRFRELRKIKKFTQNEIARRLDVSQSQVSKYENGDDEPSYETVQELAEILNTSIDYLYGKTDSPNPNLDLEKYSKDELLNKLKALGMDVSGISESKLKRLPVLGKVAAGKPIPAEEFIEGYIETETDADFALKVTGDSMEPTIPEGAIALVKKVSTSQIKNGVPCVVIINGDDGVLKRFYKDSFGFVLQSDNNKYEPIFIPKKLWEAECHFVGVVVEYKMKLV